MNITPIEFIGYYKIQLVSFGIIDYASQRLKLSPTYSGKCLNQILIELSKIYKDSGKNQSNPCRQKI